MCAFGALIKEPLLSEHELLNVHPSLLPRWRGAAPIERAIMAGDERDRRVDHAPHRRPRQRARVPGRDRADPARRHLRLARAAPAAARRRAAARCARPQSAGGPAVRRAGRGGRHLRREDRRRGPPARSRLARRPSSSASCARCTRTSARASRSPTERCSACTRRRSGPEPIAALSRALRRRAGKGPGPGSWRVTVACCSTAPKACSSCSRCSRRAGGRWTPRSYLRGHGAPGRR